MVWPMPRLCFSPLGPNQGVRTILFGTMGQMREAVWYIDINMSSHPGYGTVFTHAYMSNATTGDTYCDQATYTTYAPYTIGFTADPTSIAFGGSSTLAWSTASYTRTTYVV